MRAGATAMTLSQWKSPNSPRSQEAQQVRSIVKTLLVSFFNVDGIVHREFVPPGQTVNQQFYLNVLKMLRESMRRKRPENWQIEGRFFHHENVPVHTALSVQ